MNDIQKKIYIDKEKKQTNEEKNKQIMCTYNNETSKDYKHVQYYQWYFVTNYTDKYEWKCLFNNISHHTTLILILQGL